LRFSSDRVLDEGDEASNQKIIPTLARLLLYGKKPEVEHSNLKSRTGRRHKQYLTTINRLIKPFQQLILSPPPSFAKEDLVI
jgi:hypothetical protein